MPLIHPSPMRFPQIVLGAVPILILLLACFVAGSCGPEEIDLEARIQRIEANLVPGPGIVIKGRPVPKVPLAERMEAYAMPGVSVAVIQDFKIEWAKGYGVQDKETGSPVTPETLFQAASISKPVAAAAALECVEQGLLDLNEDINLMLKSWRVPDNEFTTDAKVTLRRILSHTAGLTVHGFPGYADGKEVPSVVQILDGEKPANTKAVRVDIEPGSQWRYSGGGYTVMQQLLIDTLDKPFPEILRELVLEPAGMTHSTYAQPLPESRAAQAAHAHFLNGTAIKGRWHTYPEMAAAGLWTTPSDLCRFALAIMEAYHGRSESPLSRETVREMLTEIDGRYGLGFSVRQDGESLRFSHGGSNAGYKCFLVAWAESGEGAAIMTNGDLGSSLVMEILGSLANEYGWEAFKPSEKDVMALTGEQLAGYAGTYNFERAGGLTVIQEGERLFIEKLYVVPGGSRRVEIFPESETRFFATETDAVFTFRKDEGGEIEGLLLEHMGRKREATRKAEKKPPSASGHRLEGVIEGFHLPSYYAGTAFASAEFVAYDCKRLALSPPYAEDMLDLMLEPTRMAAEEYGLPTYVEKDFLTTKLFSSALTAGKTVILIARDQEVLEEYQALKTRKAKAESEGRLKEVENELAWGFGRLLSYSDEVIERLLTAKH
jgi:CubicO group peptidase (beta-lactamase class C family)